MAEKFRVLISDSMSSLAESTLAASTAIEVVEQGGLSAADLLKTIDRYHGLLVRSRTKVTEEVIAAGTSLAIIGRAGIGVDNIDIAAASRRGIVVENAPNGNSITTAEHAICLLASLARNIPQATSSMKAGKWEKKKLGGRELSGKNIGVIGLGNIGRIVADRARGLRMKVLGADPFISRDDAASLGVELLELDELLARADFITIHAPLTDQTRGLLSAEQFGKMKPGVMVINAARGGIVDEAALVAALESNKVAGAAFDVFAVEPPPADHPLVNHPRVICTPHLGASTGEAQDKVAVEIASQIVAFAERGEVINPINSVAVPTDQREELQPWLELATSLGAVAGQRLISQRGSRDAVTTIEVEVAGVPAERGREAVTSAVLVGLLRSATDGPVNPVNAMVLAKELGVAAKAIALSGDNNTGSSIAVRALGGDSESFVKGTLFDVGDRLEARVVQVDGVRVEAPAAGHMLVLKNRDRPGVIGRVGTLLGDGNINVNSLHLGKDGETAVAMWNLAEALESDLLAKVRGLEDVLSAEVVSL